MHLIKFEYTNPKYETYTNDLKQKFKRLESIVSDRSEQYFLFEHSSFVFVSDFVLRIFLQRRLCLWQRSLAKLADVFKDNLF